MVIVSDVMIGRLTRLILHCLICDDGGPQNI